MVGHEISRLELANASEEGGLGIEQIRECFAIFDEIIPKLGAYQVWILANTLTFSSSIASHKARA